jgi:hypothetical protein
MHIDAIEQRSAYLGQIALDDTGCAAALSGRIAVKPTGMGVGFLADGAWARWARSIAYKTRAHRSSQRPRRSEPSRHFLPVNDLEARIPELERSNHELRAALILAGREMRKHGYGKKDTPVLRLMRRTLREARQCVAKGAGRQGQG